MESWVTQKEETASVELMRTQSDDANSEVKPKRSAEVCAAKWIAGEDGEHEGHGSQYPLWPDQDEPKQLQRQLNQSIAKVATISGD